MALHLKRLPYNLQWMGSNRKNWEGDDGSIDVEMHYHRLPSIDDDMVVHWPAL